MKYNSKITGLGIDSLHFLEDKDCNFIIIFNDNAPEELAEISVLHENTELKEIPQVGGIVKICGKKYIITCVGSEVEHTLKELGHCTMSFNGKDETSQAGTIELKGEQMKPSDIVVGGYIEIL